jgi:hypothetical protein
MHSQAGFKTFAPIYTWKTTRPWSPKAVFMQKKKLRLLKVNLPTISEICNVCVCIYIQGDTATYGAHF